MAGKEEGGDHVLSSALTSFISAATRMAQPFLTEFGLSSSPAIVYEDALNKLRAKNDKLQATLHDADERQVRDASVQLWLGELRDLQCLADDILEEFEYELEHTRRLREFYCSDAGKRKVDDITRNQFPSSDFDCLGRKIEALNKKYGEIAANREALRLRTSDGKRRSEGPGLPPSSSLCDGELHGRDKDLQNLIELLLTEHENSVCPYSTVTVVGMAGIGKTALVQHAINNSKVKNTFELQIWVWVSVNFDVITITKAINESITKQPCELGQLDVLQKVVRSHLADKRFLLVLDNLWNVSQEHWKALQVPFHSATRGSRVIITSQSSHITKTMGVSNPYHLSFLSDESCWLICKPFTFQECEIDQYIRDEIAKKSKGLPLAAKALASMLSSDPRKENWKEFLQNDLYACDEFRNQVLPLLRPSYDNLPACLKRCFVYCSLFPKDYILGKDQLVRLWIAQGFVVSNEASGSKIMEELGGKYFDDLVARSFFQLSPFYDVSEERYVMHDLLHELAQSISGKEFSRLEGYNLSEMHYGTRHWSLAPCQLHDNHMIQLEPFGGQDLRTLLLISKIDWFAFKIKIAKDLFVRLECLRALDLSNTDLGNLPDSIGRLKHLRYLCLLNTRINTLPESLCYLYNLQTLDLKYCVNLKKLPCGIQNLYSLRHLGLPSPNDSSLVMPSGIGKLINLQTLSTYVVGSDGNGGECGLAELGNLVDLRGELHISGLNNVTDVRDAEVANLKDKIKLEKLTLQWFSWFKSGNVHYVDGKLDLSVLEKLQPHNNLQELYIRDYCGIRFPKWIGDPLYIKLVKLTLQDCADFTELPPLGQLPSLKYLIIDMVNYVQCVGHEFCGSAGGHVKGFPKLEKLEFRKMREWSEWCEIEDGYFPFLKSLIIKGCPKLRNLPQLKNLKYLEIHCGEQLHFFPLFCSLICLKMVGFQHREFLVELPLLEMLELHCCEQLVSVKDIKNLTNLKHFKVIKCPVLDFPSDTQLPPQLESVYIHGACTLLNQLGSHGFKASCCQEKEGSNFNSREMEGSKFIRIIQPKRNSKRPLLDVSYCAEDSHRCRKNVKQARGGNSNWSAPPPFVCPRAPSMTSQIPGTVGGVDQGPSIQKMFNQRHSEIANASIELEASDAVVVVDQNINHCVNAHSLMKTQVLDTIGVADEDAVSQSSSRNTILGQRIKSSGSFNPLHQ